MVNRKGIQRMKLRHFCITRERLTLARLLAYFLVLSLSTACVGGSETEEGIASWYADSLHGRPTASGEPYDKNHLTAAHQTLPFGTRVTVTNQENGRSVTVVINDRGPFVAGRVIDLSGAAAERLEMKTAGTVPVTLEIHLQE